MRFEAIYLDNTIDKYVEEIAAELQKINPNKEKILSLADALDAQSKTESKARYNAALQIVEKAYGLNAADYNMAHVGPTARTLASSMLALNELGLNDEAKKEIIGKYPNMVGLSEEYIEARRRYFGYTKEEFAKIVGKFPSIIGYSEEYIEARRKYFGFTREEFAKIVGKFPSIIGYSEEYIEARRKYFGLDMKTFSGLVYGAPSISFLGEEKLERRFDWYERHFRIRKGDLITRLVEKPALYDSLFSNSFYTRVLLRTKAMTANGKTLNDVRELASVLKFNEKDFVEKHSNGISVDDYIRLKELARVADEANPKRQRSRA